MIGGHFSILYLTLTIFTICGSKPFMTLLKGIYIYIPLKSVVIRPQDKPWINSEVCWAIRKCDRLLRIHNVR